MLSEMNQDQKLFLFQILTPIFFLGFSFFVRFVWGRLNADKRVSWLLFCVGGYLAILGLAIATYLSQINVGSAISAIGIVTAAIGLGIFLKSL